MHSGGNGANMVNPKNLVIKHHKDACKTQQLINKALRGEIELNTLDLCSGIGMFTQACKYVSEVTSIKFKNIGYAEIDKGAIKAYKAINGEDVPFYEDIYKMDWKTLRRTHIVGAGFCCQDLSKANNQARGFDEGDTESKSSIIWEILSGIEQMDYDDKPIVIFLENVPDILNEKHRENFEKLLNRLKRLGYYSSFKVLQADDYGVPQMRKRFFLLATLGMDLGDAIFPAPTPLEVEFKDILEKDVDSYFDMETCTKRIDNSLSKPGNNWTLRIFNPSRARVAYTLTTQMGRASDNLIFKEDVSDDEVIRAKHHFLNKKGLTREDIVSTPFRRLTPRECARLMGLPEDRIDKLLECGLSDSQVYHICGNSICLNVMEALFEKYFNCLIDVSKEQVLSNEEITSSLNEIISLHETMRKAYFFSSPQTAYERRRYEVHHSLSTYFVYGGHEYEIKQVTECSVRNVYYKMNILIDGKGSTKDIRFIKKLLKEIQC